MWPTDKINEAANNPGPVLIHSNDDERMSLEYQINALSKKYGTLLGSGSEIKVNHSNKQINRNMPNPKNANSKDLF